jgi:hypothetical protein
MSCAGEPAAGRHARRDPSAGWRFSLVVLPSCRLRVRWLSGMRYIKPIANNRQAKTSMILTKMKPASFSPLIGSLPLWGESEISCSKALASGGLVNWTDYIQALGSIATAGALVVAVGRSFNPRPDSGRVRPRRVTPRSRVPARAGGR